MAHSRQVSRTLRFHQQSSATAAQVSQAQWMIAEGIVMAVEQIQRLIESAIRTAFLGLHQER
jgi:hypothetical protein